MHDEETLPGVELSLAISTIRQELLKAITDGQGSELAFRAGPVEIEFEVAFSRTGSTDAGVKAWVLTAAAKREVSREATHRLKVTLTPIDRATGKDATISDFGTK